MTWTPDQIDIYRILVPVGEEDWDAVEFLVGTYAEAEDAAYKIDPHWTRIQFLDGPTNEWEDA
jgi:hypothetical protein